jgi:tetratricopeptide (TPR) repeat protein
LTRTTKRERRRDLPGAVRSLRATVSIEPATGAQRTARLDDLTSLGALLAELGEAAEAENVLRQALGERATFYGVQHPGYAFGLEALAAFELSRGRALEARCLCEQALQTLLEAGHPRAAELMALRAFAAVALPDACGELYASAETLDRDTLLRMIHAVLDRAEYGEPRHALAALMALRPVVARRLGERDELALELAVAISNRAREIGDHELRIEAFSWLVATLDGLADGPRAVQAVLGLALAASDAGRPEAAERHYREAVARSEALGAAVHSDALRNHGLFLASGGRRAQAAPALLAAVSEARKAGDAALLGRALIALGIFEDHGGERRLARANLEAGLELLWRTDPDALCGRTHLEALERGLDCGCAPELRRCSEARSSPRAIRRA